MHWLIPGESGLVSRRWPTSMMMLAVVCQCSFSFQRDVGFVSRLSYNRCGAGRSRHVPRVERAPSDRNSTIASHVK